MINNTVEITNRITGETKYIPHNQLHQVLPFIEWPPGSKVVFVAMRPGSAVFVTYDDKALMDRCYLYSSTQGFTKENYRDIKKKIIEY